MRKAPLLCRFAGLGAGKDELELRHEALGRVPVETGEAVLKPVSEIGVFMLFGADIATVMVCLSKCAGSVVNIGDLHPVEVA